jgi:hypothetical protein
MNTGNYRRTPPKNFSHPANGKYRLCYSSLVKLAKLCLSWGLKDLLGPIKLIFKRVCSHVISLTWKDRLNTLGINENNVGKYLRMVVEKLKTGLERYKLEFRVQRLEVVSCGGVEEDPDRNCCIAWEFEFFDF